ncbi:MAG: YihY/virulence factor BrkB family protein [Prochloraceae cyanobacterium]|nr:YihY/virulence factor BrkB family protein [Prochloraceae cyanobacterium]
MAGRSRIAELIAKKIMGFAAIFDFFRYLNRATIEKLVVCAVRQRLTGLSAEIAYNAMLALFPAILAIFTAISIFEKSVRYSLGDLAIQLQELLPEQVWNLLLNFVLDLKIERDGDWFSLSFIVAIWIFSGALGATMGALDQIRQVPIAQKRPFWKAKLVSLVLTIGTIFLLIIASFLVFIGDLAIQIALELNWHSLFLTVWKILSGPVILAILINSSAIVYQVYQLRIDLYRKIKVIAEVIGIAIALLLAIEFFLIFINYQISSPDIKASVVSLLSYIWKLLSWPVALGIVAIAFASIYRFGPSVCDRSTPIFPGAILAAIFWAIVSALFRLYVSNFGNYNKVYGTVGAAIVLMLWLYISSFVMLLGYQLNVIVGEAMENNRKKTLNLPSGE